MNYRSYFLLEISCVESRKFKSSMSINVSQLVNPLEKHDIYDEGNMVNISDTIPIIISRTPDVVENVFIGADYSQDEILQYMALFKEFCDVFSWSYEEMTSINTRIIEHEIHTYENANPVRKKMQPVNPRKATTIKAEVENMFKVRFIYIVPLTKWVSKLVPIDKK